MQNMKKFSNLFWVVVAAFALCFSAAVISCANGSSSSGSSDDSSNNKDKLDLRIQNGGSIVSYSRAGTVYSVAGTDGSVSTDHVKAVATEKGIRFTITRPDHEYYNNPTEYGSVYKWIGITRI